MDHSISCKNCGNSSSNNFCENCGQRTSINRVTFKETFSDLKDYTFSINAPFFKTLELLFVNPGKVLREYLNGRRKSYYKPVAFFLLVTLFYLLCKFLIDFNPLPDRIKPTDAIGEYEIFSEAGYFMFANIDKILFIFVFTLGIALKGFFYKKYSLAEYIAISFFLVGVYILCGVVNMFALTYISKKLSYLALGLFLLYLTYALISLFQKKKLLVGIKSILVYFISVFFYMVFGYGLSLLIVMLKQ